MGNRKKSRSAGGSANTGSVPEGRSVYSGYHAVFEALRTSRLSGTVYIAGKNKKARDIEELARNRSLPVEHVDHEELARLGGEETRGAAFVGNVASKGSPRTLEGFLTSLQAKVSLVIVLDGITDPHNVGAILRNADQFGVDLVISRERRAASDTATLTRTSAGAAAYVPRLTVPNISQALGRLQEAGFWVYGADADGTAVSSLTLTGRTALVLGSEGEGLSRLVREGCDELVSIPTKGHVDSLNVSVAAGILMYEMSRREA
ncbi:MAG: 23S rRNA (guanosine(2251)-2'-O)-methyltransferase RlmB [Spirochaetes bacterium]|jgi:23S rRNA (guanosine2251-2'-O)-methyltransferase|nr:23S rRNA (guanosine(2251)-2'-O)-methyltransferase RlmB [Spirochaetota bacterium]